MIESPRHELDEAIDRVAAKMVAADEDAAVLRRVMARLPERTATPWFLTVPAQAGAAVALLLLAFVYANPSREVTSVEALPAAERALVTEAPPLEAPPRLAVAPIPGLRSLIPDPRSPIPDHERSLQAVTAIESLELIEIAPSAIEVGPAVLEPLVLTELALETKGDS